MRKYSATVYAKRYAVYKYRTGTYRLVNTGFNFTSIASERPDVQKAKKPIIDGFRPPMPYYARFSGADCINVNTEVVDGDYTYLNQGKLGSHTEETTIQVTEVELLGLYPSQNDVAQAVIKARNNVADRAASFGESLAEARKTISYLGSMAGSLDNFLVAAGRKDWRNAARSLGVKPGDPRNKRAVRNLQGSAGTASNAWLAYNFAIQPIISDMVSLCILLGGEWSFRVTGKTVLITSKGSSTTPQLSALGYAPANVRWFLHENRLAGVHARLDYELSDKYLQGFAKFGVTDAVQVAWALVPSSFLVDFVLPVSEVLRSLTATIGLDFKSGSYTRFSRLERKSSDCKCVPKIPGVVIKSESFLEARVTGRMMNRDIYDTEPNPVTLWVKDPFDAFKVTTVLAVLGQRLSKLSPKR